MTRLVNTKGYTLKQLKKGLKDLGHYPTCMGSMKRIEIERYIYLLEDDCKIRLEEVINNGMARDN
jgi:hypothetical protein